MLAPYETDNRSSLASSSPEIFPLANTVRVDDLDAERGPSGTEKAYR